MKDYRDIEILPVLTTVSWIMW